MRRAVCRERRRRLRHALVTLLRRHDAHATFFVNERWARANPRTFAQLAEDPFEIANHGTRHMPLSVTGRSAYGERGRATRARSDEIAGNSDYLAQHLGHRPAWFRSGTAYYDEVAVAIAEAIGERVIGSAVSGDAGRRSPPIRSLGSSPPCAPVTSSSARQPSRAFHRGGVCRGPPPCSTASVR